jgi:hypothetical protein
MYSRKILELFSSAGQVLASIKTIPNIRLLLLGGLDHLVEETMRVVHTLIALLGTSGFAGSISP